MLCVFPGHLGEVGSGAALDEAALGAAACFQRKPPSSQSSRTSAFRHVGETIRRAGAKKGFQLDKEEPKKCLRALCADCCFVLAGVHAEVVRHAIVGGSDSHCANVLGPGTLLAILLLAISLAQNLI